MSVTVTGVDGSIRWAYHVAGALSSWTVTSEGGQTCLSATLSSQDAFRLSQRPLAFVVIRQGCSWRWPIVGELQIVGASLSAVLGPKES